MMRDSSDDEATYGNARLTFASVASFPLILAAVLWSTVGRTEPWDSPG